MLKTEKKTKAKSNLNLVLEALRYHEICYATAHFSGANDSGGIEEIYVQPLDQEEEFDSTALLDTVKVTTLDLEPELAPHDFNTGRPRSWIEKPPSLREAIELVCYDMLDERAPGYEIERGGQGTITLRPLGPIEPTPKPIVTFELYENEEEYDDDDEDDDEEYYSDEGPE
jgi:hypothetical protein